MSHPLCYTTGRGAFYLRDKRQGFEADIVPSSSDKFKESVAISTLITNSPVVLLNYAEEQFRIYVSFIYLFTNGLSNDDVRCKGHSDRRS